MISIRHSPGGRNRELVEDDPKVRGKLTNRQWLTDIEAEGGLLLLGGSSLAHFRVRVAQSHLRQDMLPSFWSLAGLLDGPLRFISVPFHWTGDGSEVPAVNALQTCRMRDYDDPRAFPNIAVIRFSEDFAEIRRVARKVKGQRSIIDLPSLVLPWLAFVWGAGSRKNPLLEGQGLPSAAFVETVYAIAGIELTPGLSSASSCPEAIWQSAKWWRKYYEEAASDEGPNLIPEGRCLIRQPEAAVLEPVETKKKRRSRKKK